MNGDRSGGPQDDDSGSWTTETLPLSVRKELLERELAKLGFRKGGSRESGSAQQQQPQGSSHPSAGDDGGSGHGD